MWKILRGREEKQSEAELSEEFGRMGWVWKDDEPDESNSSAGDVSDSRNPRSGDRCSTRKVVKSQCRTEEVEPGKFIRKCEKTEELLRECVGKYGSIFIYVYMNVCVFGLCLVSKKILVTS